MSKFTIPPKKTVRITDHPDANTTLYVDSGSVHLADDEDQHALTGGPIALDSGPVVLRNPNAKAAVVFAAVADAGDDLWCAYCPTEKRAVVPDLNDPADAMTAAQQHNTDHPGHGAFPKPQAS